MRQRMVRTGVARLDQRWLLVMAAGLLALGLSGCAVLPSSVARARGDQVLRSPGCQCRMSYPASWGATAANGDSSEPALGLHSYDASSSDHAPIPARFADVGINWLNDATGQLYLAATTGRFATGAHHLTVSGWPATSFAHWTASPRAGGVFEQHVYLFVPWYQRDYDISFRAANPPSGDIAPLQRIFARMLHSFVVVPPNAVP